MTHVTAITKTSAIIINNNLMTITITNFIFKTETFHSSLFDYYYYYYIYFFYFLFFYFFVIQVF